jgi:hypothetical protein
VDRGCGDTIASDEANRYVILRAVKPAMGRREAKGGREEGGKKELATGGK